MRHLLLILTAVALSSCALLQQPARVIVDPTTDWRSVATASDRERLRQWRDAFTTAVAQARQAGHSETIDREGALLQPDSAIPGVPIPNGRYRCRMTKLGAKSQGMLDYVAYPYFSCRIRQEREVQGFAKLSGSQRQVGLIFRNDALRQVFLGTLVLGDENRAMQYGQDMERDLAGYVEKIGPNRWRLILPYPHFESVMDVIELVPDQ